MLYKKIQLLTFFYGSEPRKTRITKSRKNLDKQDKTQLEKQTLSDKRSL